MRLIIVNQRVVVHRDEPTVKPWAKYKDTIACLQTDAATHFIAKG